MLQSSTEDQAADAAKAIDTNLSDRHDGAEREGGSADEKEEEGGRESEFDGEGPLLDDFDEGRIDEDEGEGVDELGPLLDEEERVVGEGEGEGEVAARRAEARTGRLP